MKRFGLLIFTIIAVSVFCYLRTRPDGNLHIVFCDVGQGDAIYLMLPDGSDMLVDGGRGSGVLTCLGDHMAFWDRHLTIVALTHPQADHYGGLKEVLQRYSVDTVLLPRIYSKADSYSDFIRHIEEKDIRYIHVNAGDKILPKNSINPLKNYIKNSDEKRRALATISVVWPSIEWTISHSSKIADSPEEWQFRDPHPGEDPNDFSLVLLISYLDFDVLLTGDAEVSVLQKAIAPAFLEKEVIDGSIEVLKISHHGSEEAVSEAFLDTIRPELSVLSVGAKNRYGHPSPSILSLLADGRVPLLRTDRDGTIHIVSDGEQWWVR